MAWFDVRRQKSWKYLNFQHWFFCSFLNSMYGQNCKKNKFLERIVGVMVLSKELQPCNVMTNFNDALSFTVCFVQRARLLSAAHAKCVAMACTVAMRKSIGARTSLSPYLVTFTSGIGRLKLLRQGIRCSLSWSWMGPGLGKHRSQSEAYLEATIFYS